jgi:hypothetical protein
MVLNTTIAANAEANSLKNVVVNGTASLILNQPLPSPLSRTPQNLNIPQLRKSNDTFVVEIHRGAE